MALSPLLVARIPIGAFAGSGKNRKNPYIKYTPSIPAKSKSDIIYIFVFAIVFGFGLCVFEFHGFISLNKFYF